MIYILTGPIYSGKTTALFEFIKERDNVKGFLCPYIDKMRFGFEISSKDFFPLEISESKVDSIEIGRFVFDNAGFNRMRELFKSINEKDLIDFFIIDEVGKLELEGRGLEPDLGIFLSEYLKERKLFNLIIVVRDYLLDEVINHYGLQAAKVIESVAILGS